MIAALASATVLAVVAGVFMPGGRGSAPDPNQPFTAPGTDPMTFDEARGEFYRLAPALLLVVYDAFERTAEDEIYVTLAAIAGEDPIEALSFERVGSMAAVGLAGYLSYRPRAGEIAMAVKPDARKGVVLRLMAADSVTLLLFSGIIALFAAALVAQNAEASVGRLLALGT